MLHESAPDRVSRGKSAESRRPASGNTRNHRDPNNNYGGHHSFRDHNGPRYHSLEPPIPVPPLFSLESPRRKRVNVGGDGKNGASDSDPPTRRPPVPLVIDRRSRHDEIKSVSLNMSVGNESCLVVVRPCGFVGKN